MINNQITDSVEIHHIGWFILHSRLHFALLGCKETLSCKTSWLKRQQQTELQKGQGQRGFGFAKIELNKDDKVFQCLCWGNMFLD